MVRRKNVILQNKSKQTKAITKKIFFGIYQKIKIHMSLDDVLMKVLGNNILNDIFRNRFCLALFVYNKLIHSFSIVKNIRYKQQHKKGSFVFYNNESLLLLSFILAVVDVDIDDNCSNEFNNVDESPQTNS